MSKNEGYSQIFGDSGVKRSSGFCTPKPVAKDFCEPPARKPEPEFPSMVRKIVTNVSVACHEETGKLWEVQTCVVWDESCCKWVESCEGIRELTAVYKQGATLPSFNGVISVYIADGSVVDVFGGGETPQDMIGAIFCINGELCYLGDAPAQPIPVEVQNGGSMPTADSGVKLWNDGGVLKYPGQDGWIQATTFGAS